MGSGAEQEPVREHAPIEGESTAVAERPFSPVAVSEQNETSAAIFGARERAAIEARTIVAMRNRRNFETSRTELLAVCTRLRFADAAVYEKPVGGGKKAVGMSIRFAEEFARAWGNLDVGVSVVSEDDERRVIEAVAVDYQKNIVYRSQAVVPKYVERLHPRNGEEIIGQRTNSRGVVTYKIRADDGALFTTTQAAAAKATREVILKHCPADLRDECFERCEQTMQEIGGKDPDSFRKQIVDAFFKLGVTREQLDAYVGRSVSQINVAEMHQLRRLAQALKQGETTWAEAMNAKSADSETPEKTPAPSTAKGTAGLKADIAAKTERPPARDAEDQIGNARGAASSSPDPQPAPSSLTSASTPEKRRTAELLAGKVAARKKWDALMAKGDKRSEFDNIALDDLNTDYPEFNAERQLNLEGK